MTENSDLEPKCLICGGQPTVKSHLIPRSLILDIKGNQPYLISGTIDQNGIIYNQNGRWDKELLCKKHEDQIGKADKYAAELLRRDLANAKKLEGGLGIEVNNENPELLSHFIYACIWRSVVSSEGNRLRKFLGRYEDIIRSSLLNNGPYDLPAFIQLHRVKLKGNNIKIVTYANRIRVFGLNAWQIYCGEFAFSLVVDRRNLSIDLLPFLVSNNKLVFSYAEQINITESPAFASVLAAMHKR